MINWGDVPTWLAVAAAIAAGVVAGWQLRLQRIQLREQQEVLADQARLLERQQADQIDVVAITLDGGLAKVKPADASVPVNVAVVINSSKRPVRNVICRMDAASVKRDVVISELGDVVMDMRLMEPDGPGQIKIGEPRNWEFREDVFVLRAGGAAGFAFPFDAADYLTPQFTIRFTDDAGIHWQMDDFLHLEKLPNRHDW